MIFPLFSRRSIGVYRKKEVESVPGLVPVAGIHGLFGRKCSEVKQIDLQLRAVLASGDIGSELERALFQE